MMMMMEKGVNSTAVAPSMGRIRRRMSSRFSLIHLQLAMMIMMAFWLPSSTILLTADAFVIPRQQYPSTTTTVQHATVNWKDLPVPELPVQQVKAAVSSVQTSVAESSFSFPSVNFDSLNLPTTEVFDNLPSQINPDALFSLFQTSFVTTPWHVEAIVLFAFGNWLLRAINAPLDLSRAPFVPGTDTYSPQQSNAFYSQRPWMVARRMIKLAYISGAFTSGILWDWLVLGKLLKDEEYTALKRAEPRRAKEALRLCEQLGPTFIKLGQALSIRTDLIPEAYALELRALQDAVPPFPSAIAKEILQREFNVDDLSYVFAELTPEPIASASVGQVYKGILAVDGITEVAVKVQRPGILAEIALDLYILRLLTPIQTRLQNFFNGATTDQDDIDLTLALVDEWGRGFVAETDYRLEAQNTINFEKAMRQRQLDAVCAPTVVTELVRDKVLVTEWVQGTRLDLDASQDVPRLCGVAINAYLTMLLDTGVLHCDPHKGNLLRTTDGRLCILDWGMTLDVPNDLQYSMLEFIAHINVEDYDAIPQDFINLGFSPPDVTVERLRGSGITEGLSFTFRQLAAGGGPKKIQERVQAEFQQRYGSDLTPEELREAARADMMERMEAQLASEGVDVKGVTNMMEEVSKRNRELFSLPPYVLYLARAFSTLEGIGLSIDENYSIIQECYPYLASRLFTDRNPRAKKALKAMLGLTDEEVQVGPKTTQEHAAGTSGSGLPLVQRAMGSMGDEDGESIKGKGLSPTKLLEMSEGFASYTAATANVDREGKGQLKAATEFSKLFLDPQGSTLQDILVEETAKYGDAVTRATLRTALVDNPAAKAALSANQRLDSFLPNGPLKSLFINRPADFAHYVETLVATNPEDEKILSNVQELTTALGEAGSAQRNGKNKADEVLPEKTNTPVLVSQPQPTQENKASSVSPSTIVTDLWADEETRQALVQQLPGALALGRRLGAGLLRRAAYRTEKSPGLPETTRKRLIEANRAFADALEPPQDNNNDQDDYEERWQT